MMLNPHSMSCQCFLMGHELFIFKRLEPRKYMQSIDVENQEVDCMSVMFSSNSSFQGTRWSLLINRVRWLFRLIFLSPYTINLPNHILILQIISYVIILCIIDHTITPDYFCIHNYHMYQLHIKVPIFS